MNIPLYMENHLLVLQSKYPQEIAVKWVWAAVILLSAIGCIGYVVYCNWVGGTFAEGARIGVPDLVHVTFNCKRRYLRRREPLFYRGFLLGNLR